MSEVAPIITVGMKVRYCLGATFFKGCEDSWDVLPGDTGVVTELRNREGFAVKWDRSGDTYDCHGVIQFSPQGDTPQILEVYRETWMHTWVFGKKGGKS